MCDQFNDLLIELVDVLFKKKYKSEQIQNVFSYYQHNRITFDDCIKYIKRNTDIFLLYNNKFNDNINEFIENDRQNVLNLGKWLSFVDESCKINKSYLRTYNFKFYTDLFQPLSDESKQIFLNKLRDLIDELSHDFSDVK